MDFYEIYFPDKSEEKDFPTLSEFKRYYDQGAYLKAIGLDFGASTEEIISAVDAFEFEYWDESEEWTIPLQKIKEALLEVTSEKSYKPQQTSQTLLMDANLEEIQGLLWNALELEKNYQYQAALEIINRVIEIAPLAECYDFKGDIYRDRGEYYGDELNLIMAIELYKTAIKINPDYTRPYTGMALAYADLGGNENLKKARHYYQIALSHEPNSLILYLDKMELEICMGEYDSVLGTFGEISHLIVTMSDKLISNYLVSLALALLGRDYQEYVEIFSLENLTVEYGWSILPIETHMNKLKKESADSQRVQNALHIHEFFKKYINHKGVMK